MGTTFGSPSESPYLANAGRLGDVIAAHPSYGNLQVL